MAPCAARKPLDFQTFRPILLNGHIPIQVQAAVPTPKLFSSLHPIELPRTDPTLVFHTLSWTVKENEPPLFSSQTCAVDGVEPKRFNPAVPHRFRPLSTVNGGAKPVLEADDDMTRFVDHRLSSILF